MNIFLYWKETINFERHVKLRSFDGVQVYVLWQIFKGAYLWFFVLYCRQACWFLSHGTEPSHYSRVWWTISQLSAVSVPCTLILFLAFHLGQTQIGRLTNFVSRMAICNAVRREAKFLLRIQVWSIRNVCILSMAYRSIRKINIPMNFWADCQAFGLNIAYGVTRVIYDVRLWLDTSNVYFPVILNINCWKNDH